MNSYKADIHIHTVLSPCADLAMSPVNIVAAALSKSLDIIGITDHNSTLNCKVVQEIGTKYGLFVMMGVEVTSKEEVHCLAYFETISDLLAFQKYIDKHLPYMPNDIQKFGYQLVVNEQEEVLQEIDTLLITAINQSVSQIEKKVHELHGLFIPAHIDKNRNSIISQLGFIPEDIPLDAIELSSNFKSEVFIQSVVQQLNIPVVTSSDAHYLEQIGAVSTLFKMKSKCFSEIRKAFKSVNKRGIIKT